MEKKKVAILTGTRADYGLLAPVIKRLKSESNLTLLVTGTHLSSTYGDTREYIDTEVAQIHIPILLDYDHDVAVNTGMSLCIHNVSNTLANLRPDILVVLGDRWEALATCIAAYNLHIPICHIQGGDVTKGSLDDGYRDCITRLSSLHLVAEGKAYDRVEDIITNSDSLCSKNIHIVGSLACIMPYKVAIEQYDYILAIHPPLHEELQQIMEGLDGIADKRVLMIGSNADCGGRTINSYFEVVAECIPNWDYIPSIERHNYLRCLAGAKVLIGNSSSGIFEAPMLNTKTINIGSRQDGRLRAKSIIQVDDIKDLAEAIELSKAVSSGYECPYYIPDTVAHIVKHILEYK